MEQWERRFCFNRACTIGTWMVAQPHPAQEIWLVAREQNDNPYTVAGEVPVCLYCGDDLVTTVDLEGGFGQSEQGEQGPVFDFLRRL